MVGFLDDCPICEKIKSNKLAAKGTHCSLLLMDGVQVAALNHHEIKASPEALSEAFTLLEQFTSNGYVAEFPDAPGHWAMKIVKTTDLPIGKSSSRI